MFDEFVKISSSYCILPNVQYRKVAGVELSLDIYLPKDNFEVSASDFKAINQLPTVAHFHGGGWTEGCKEANTLQVLPYLHKGWAAVNVQYRLANEALAPAAVEDVRYAVWWVKRNASRYGFDPDRMILTGQSAGGHLALLAGMLPVSAGFDANNPELTNPSSMINRCNATLSELTVAAIISWAGVADVKDLITEPNMRNFALIWLGAQGDREIIAERVSPLNYIRPGLPPILSLHGDKDVVVPYTHSLRFHEALDKHEIPNHLHTIKGKEHFSDFSVEDYVEAFGVIDSFLCDLGF